MSGICGKFEFESGHPADPKLISSMCDSLKHRGQAGKAVFTEKEFGLGVTLSSISNGGEVQHQTFNKNRNFIVAFDGQIYNSEELRRTLKKKGRYFETESETEVIARLYEEYNTDCIKLLNGMFALAIWDRREKALLLARDRFGAKPLFYTVQPGWLSFGSELKAILCDSRFSRRLDYTALHNYLSYNYVPSPKTLFEGISSLLPGQMLLCSKRGPVSRKYWNVNNIGKETYNESFYIKNFYDMLKQAVVRQLNVTGTTGIFFSGGIDSSTIAYIASHYDKISIEAFTAGYNESRYDSTKDALQLARKLNIKCTRINIEPGACRLLPKIIRHCDNLVADPSIIPMYVMSDVIKNKARINVALCAGAADTLMGGFDTYRADIITFYYSRLAPQRIKERLSVLVNKFRGFGWPVSKNYRIKHFFKGAKYSLAKAHYYWRSVFNEEEKKLLYNCHFRGLSKEDPFDIYNKRLRTLKSPQDFNKILNADTEILLPNFLLAKVDSAGMAWGLEIRDPFLDNDLAEFIIRMPFALKIRRLSTKYILKKTMFGRLPRKVVFAQKRGLSMPVGEWIRGECRDMVTDYLSKETLKKIGCFDVKYVHRLLDRHLSDVEDNTWKLWGLLNFSIWHDLFLS